MGLPWTNNSKQKPPKLPQGAPKPGGYSAGPAETVRGSAKHADNQRTVELIKSYYPDRGNVPGPRGQP